MCVFLAYMLHYIAPGNRLASVFPVFNHIPGINVASPVYGSSQSHEMHTSGLLRPGSVDL